MHYEVLSLYVLENRCYEKHNYHSYTLLLEDILNTQIRQRNLPQFCLLGKGVVKSLQAGIPSFKITWSLKRR